MGKFIIPWYGGLPSAWTGCLIFFQAGLLGGYLYAHLLVRSSRAAPAGDPARCCSLVSRVCALPIAPGGSGSPRRHALDGREIFLLLGATVGLPYLTARVDRTDDAGVVPPLVPDRRALPLVRALEPRLDARPALVSVLRSSRGSRAPTQGWIVGRRASRCSSCRARCARFSSAAGAAPSSARGAAAQRRLAPTALTRFLVGRVARVRGACSLLSVTNQLCQGIPSVPFLLGAAASGALPAELHRLASSGRASTSRRRSSWR